MSLGEVPEDSGELSFNPQLYLLEQAAQTALSEAKSATAGLAGLVRQRVELVRAIDDLESRPGQARRQISQAREEIGAELRDLTPNQGTLIELYAVTHAPIEQPLMDFATRVSRVLGNFGKKLTPGTPVLRITNEKRAAFGISPGEPPRVFLEEKYANPELSVPVRDKVSVQGSPYPHIDSPNKFDTPTIVTGRGNAIKMSLVQAERAAKPYEDDDPFRDDPILIGDGEISRYLAALAQKFDQGLGDKTNTQPEELLFAIYMALGIAQEGADINIDLPPNLEELIDCWRTITIDTTAELLTRVGKSLTVGERGLAEGGKTALRESEFRSLGIKCRILGVTKPTLMREILRQRSLAASSDSEATPPTADISDSALLSYQLSTEDRIAILVMEGYMGL